MKQTVNHEICNWITKKGVKYVFLVPGLQIEPFSVEITNNEYITPIIACHELGAGFMADGYARASSNIGICASIGGPGAAYMLPSAMIARVDQSPVLFITGDVPLSLKHHFSFQDTGIIGSRDRETYTSLIDFSETIEKPENTLSILNNVNSRLNRRLPAHLVVPFDVQELIIKEDTPCSKLTKGDSEADEYDNPNETAKGALKIIENAKHPIIIVGNRLSEPCGVDNLIAFAEKTGIKIATTYGGKGQFPEDHQLSLGIFGFAGSKLAHDEILGTECDLLILLGVNISQRDTFHFHSKFMPKGRKVISIDNTNAISNFKNHDLHQFKLKNISSFIELLALEASSLKSKKELPQYNFEKRQVSSSSVDSSYKNHPSLFWALLKLRELTPPETMLFMDSGSQRVFAGLAWKVTKPFTFFTSDLQAPMGWAICAAIGAKLARPKSPTIVLTSDGSMRMHCMEIASAARYSIPIIYLVANNASYSSIEKRAKNNSFKKEIGQLPLINWSDFAKSVGADGCVVSKSDELDEAYNRALNSEKPFVIDLRTHPEEPPSEEIAIPASLWPDFV